MQTHTIDLDAVPPMLSTYGRAILGARSKSPQGDVPRIEARVRGVEIDGEEVEAYNRVSSILERKDGRIPATYPQVLAAPVHGRIITHDAFGLPAMGMIHVGQRIDYMLPVYPGDRLDLECWVEGKRDHRVGFEFDLVTEFKVGIKTVWRGVTTAIVRDPSKESDTKKREQKPGVPGDLTRSTVWEIPADQGRQYARVSGDYNPIHLFKPTAKALGFKRQIVHGMWSVARSLGELDTSVPEPEMCMDVRFKKPLYLPSKVVFSCRETDDAIKFWIHSEDAETTHVEATITRPDSD